MEIKHQQTQSPVLFVLSITMLLLQVAIVPQLGIFAGKINLMLILALYVCLNQKTTHPVVFSFVAGVLFDLATTGPLGLMALCLTLVSGWITTFVLPRYTGEVSYALIIATVSSLTVSLLYHIILLIVSSEASFFSTMLVRMLPTFLCTLIVSIPFFVHPSARSKNVMGARSKRSSFSYRR